MMKVYSFRSDEKLIVDFQKKYPRLMAYYINCALKFALQNRDNFNLVLAASDEKTVKEV